MGTVIFRCAPKSVETIKTDEKETKADVKQLLMGQSVIMGRLD